LGISEKGKIGMGWDVVFSGVKMEGQESGEEEGQKGLFWAVYSYIYNYFF
jgi:hypothetical protein